MAKGTILVNSLKNIIYILLPAGIAFYIMYPLLAGDYIYHSSEYELWKSFMVNFIEALKRGELPTWNEYVGGGHPAMYFGHYPISQNTLFYMLFGVSDFTCNFTKFLGLIILLLGFIYACQYLRLGYLVSLIGALTYFSINLVSRFIVADTVGNLFLVYPLLMIFIFKIIDENKKKDILIFSLFYIFWLSGNHIIYVYMHLAMLSIVYWVTAFVFYEFETFKLSNLKKFISLYLVLFVLPFLTTLYQYYFVYDVLSTSNRLEEGLIVSPFEAVAWKQLIVSFQSSSYFWIGLFSVLIYAGFKLLTVKYSFIETKKVKVPLWLLLLFMPPFLYGIKSITPKERLGDNIVVNAEFSVDTSGWASNLCLIESVPGGKSGNALQITASENATGYAYFTVPTETGKKYRIEACYKRGTAANGQIKVGPSIDDNTLYYSGVLSNDNWMQYSGTFNAITSTTYITLVNLTSVKGQTSFFDATTLNKVELDLRDYAFILNSTVFQIALILYLLINFFILYKKDSSIDICLSALLNLVLVFVAYVSLLAYYFYSPENILGYDYLFFRELSVPFQIVFTLFVLYSLKDYQNNKVVKIVVLSAIVLYFIRSHFTIPLLRFTGIIWYSVRDGSIFSFFFAVLFMFGLKGLISDFSNFRNREGVIVKCVQYGLLFFVLILLVQDSFNKFYKGTSNRLIWPNQGHIANTPGEKRLLDAQEELVSLNNFLLTLDKQTKHFYRIFTPEITTSYMFLAGNWQQHKIYEAAMYDSSISKGLKDFYDYTILGKRPPDTKELKNVMQCNVFTRHVHEGLNFYPHESVYSRFFTLLLFPNDIPYIRDKNLDFLWDIMQVKYLIIGPELSKVLENSTNPEYYQLLGSYPILNSNLYEITKNKSYSKLAILPLDDQQNYDEVIKELNSTDIDVLRTLYSKLVFLDRNTADFALLKNQNSASARLYEVFSTQNAILIDFESWNHNWKLKINNKNKKLRKAFQMFRGIKLKPGLNKIELTYNLKYFKELFMLSIFVVLIYVILLVRSYYIEKINKETT